MSAAECLSTTNPRADGSHSWRFEGDDPYMLCVYCGERRDVLTGRALPLAAPPSPEQEGKDE